MNIQLGLLGCDAVSLGKYFARKDRTAFVFLVKRSKEDEGNIFRRNVGKCSVNDTGHITNIIRVCCEHNMNA